jgi:hypothetical protein
MIVVKTTKPAFVSSSYERNDYQPGRCVYCDQRCNSDATSHDYCRVEHEHEESRELESVAL